MSSQGQESSAIRVRILVVSDSAARGEAEDRSGPLLRELAEAERMSVAELSVVADDQEAITAWLLEAAPEADLLLTCGGTGLGPRDVTPQATLKVLDFEVPGIAEALRAAGLKHTPHAMLSRAVAGVRGRTLVVNLPGSPRAVSEQFAVLAPVAVHAVALLRGQTAHDDDRRRPGGADAH